MSRTKDESNVYIKMKATEEERNKIRECADYNGISISDLIRLGLNTIGGLDLEYGNEKRKTKKENDRKEETTVYSEIEAG